MTGNQTVTSSFKYAKIGYEFLKDKYFKLVPFAGELNQVYTEIVDEIKELAKLPSIAYLIQRYEEMSAKIKWFCDFIDLDENIRKLITIIHVKMTDMKQTALEAENK